MEHKEKYRIEGTDETVGIFGLPARAEIYEYNVANGMYVHRGDRDFDFSDRVTRSFGRLRLEVNCTEEDDYLTVSLAAKTRARGRQGTGDGPMRIELLFEEGKEYGYGIVNLYTNGSGRELGICRDRICLDVTRDSVTVSFDSESLGDEEPDEPKPVKPITVSSEPPRPADVTPDPPKPAPDGKQQEATSEQTEDVPSQTEEMLGLEKEKRGLGPKIKGKTNHLLQLEAQVNDLRCELAEKEAKCKEAEEECGRLDARIESITEEIGKYKKDLDDKNQQLAELTKKKESVFIDLTSQNILISQCERFIRDLPGEMNAIGVGEQGENTVRLTEENREWIKKFCAEVEAEGHRIEALRKQWGELTRSVADGK